MSSPLDRASAEDVTSLVTDDGPAPLQVGAILMLDTPDGFDAGSVVEVLTERIRSIPRLRQRLVPTPFGCGRPVWVDDADFALSRHVRIVDCPGEGGEAALLGLAAGLCVTPLARDRPLWSATLVEGVDPHRSALVFVFHHVLADGIGGLAVLAQLVDGNPTPPPVAFPRPAPSGRQIAIDAIRSRLHALTHLEAGMGRLRGAAAELRTLGPGRTAPTSLNRPTGPRRSFTVTRTDLERTRAVAHADGATINDVLLVAIAAALRTLLSSRGETVDSFVMSIPISGRRQTNADQLGNQVDVAPVAIPATGELRARIRATSEATRAARRAPRSASTALLGPAFRVLAHLHLFQWAINRQRLVHTFVTNLRGPDASLAVATVPIREVLPVSALAGNVTVAFAILSYAGTLAITVIADPDACDDLPALGNALQAELDQLTAESAPSAPSSSTASEGPTDPPGGSDRSLPRRR